MSIAIKNIEVNVKGRFTPLPFLGDGSYAFCHDVRFGEPNMFTAIFVPQITLDCAFASMTHRFSKCRILPIPRAPLEHTLHFTVSSL